MDNQYKYFDNKLSLALIRITDYFLTCENIMPADVSVLVRKGVDVPMTSTHYLLLYYSILLTYYLGETNRTETL